MADGLGVDVSFVVALPSNCNGEICIRVSQGTKGCDNVQVCYAVLTLINEYYILKKLGLDLNIQSNLIFK